jgi:hypothetical protein
MRNINRRQNIVTMRKQRPAQLARQTRRPRPPRPLAGRHPQSGNAIQ